MKALLIFFLLTLQVSFVNAQSTPSYFDKTGKSTSESMAYYYRQPSGSSGAYESFYISNGSKYFEGTILTASNTDEDKNVYTGICTWYYKNGKKKVVRSFNEKGVENGVSYFYYENGKLSKEIEYRNGSILDNLYKEYNEHGEASRIFEDDFSKNINDWDLYVSDLSSARFSDGVFELKSFSKEGTSRYISVPSNNNEFILETIIDVTGLPDGEKGGLIFGFKDWQNYNFYLVTNSSFYIGTVYEGVTSVKAEGMYSNAIHEKGFNSIKILSNGEKNIYSINGEIQFSSDSFRNYGNKAGIAISGKSSVKVEKLLYKDMAAGSYDSERSHDETGVKGTGSGILFSKNGLILTNHHVIENSKKVIVDVCIGGECKSYNAVVIQDDTHNDVAILKIEDTRFQNLDTIRYAFKENGSLDVGSSVFTIGYPMALSGMGKEPKFTDGKISAKTGFNNAINVCQTSIPVQAGNSGGPLFNDKGQLLGLINAKVKGADNVSYAVKLNYITNIIDLLNERPPIPADNSITELSLEEKIRALSNYVVLVKVK